MGETRRAQFERVQRLYGHALLRVVRTYATPQSADERDLLQSVALALWTGLPGFRGDCPERAFVLRIAHNQGLNFLWRRRRTEEVSESLVDPSPLPEEHAVQKESVRHLYAALRELRPSLRQVVSLALEGLPPMEIGAALGLSPDNVAVRLTRARAALRELLTREVRHVG